MGDDEPEAGNEAGHDQEPRHHHRPPSQAATDPIQQLFADKVKEYAKKKAAGGGKLPDATKETEAAIAMELEKVAQAYGGGAGVDMSKFPDLKFVDPVADDVPLK